MQSDWISTKKILTYDNFSRFQSENVLILSVKLHSSVLQRKYA